MSSMMSPLISTEALADRLAAAQAGSAPPLRLFDVTTHLRPAQPGPWRVESGRADFLAGHIPGAAYLDLQGELSDTTSPLRFTLPPAERLAAAFAARGLGDGDDCVVYSSTAPMWASRVWWMLQGLGVPARVLDGGLARWRAEGRPLASGEPGPGTAAPPARLTPRPQPRRWADKQDVLLAIGQAGVCTLNALAADQHDGSAAVHYGRPGHILGSVNLPWTAVLDAQGCLRPADELRAHFSAVGAMQARRVVCYCGGGIAATLDALALQIAGHPDVAVYDASLQEWAADPALPMATSTAT